MKAEITYEHANPVLTIVTESTTEESPFLYFFDHKGPCSLLLLRNSTTKLLHLQLRKGTK